MALENQDLLPCQSDHSSVMQACRLQRGIKSPVPSIFNGVLINHIELLHHIFPELTQIKIKSDNNMVTFVNIVFDQKVLSPGSRRYKNALYGIDPVIKADSLADTYQDGYHVLLQYLINSFKAETITWVKQVLLFSF